MATPINPGGRNFKPVKRSYNVQRDSRSHIESAQVHPSGRALLNVKATSIQDGLATEAGQEIERYNTHFEVDEINQLVSVHIAADVWPGVMPVRRSADGRTVSIHLGGVFQEYPSLRPAGKRKCQVWKETDSTGRSYMIISLGTALGTRTTPRDNSDQQG